ncbi:hypothetical protein GIB67_007320 [Kingdonia uniflora]|uniref:YDG domain-containing protein n=1 Tax=Kingdonia uniflora TaxID=39325 RepID=A0A7J7NXB6_9MAGN|nr:hypothetical protein GIB67_007320 [Kingdonia uniflora]
MVTGDDDTGLTSRKRSSESVVRGIYKQQRVSAFHNFPRGCGRFSSFVNVTPSADDPVENLKGRPDITLEPECTVSTKKSEVPNSASDTDWEPKFFDLLEGASELEEGEWAESIDYLPEFIYSLEDSYELEERRSSSIPASRIDTQLEVSDLLESKSELEEGELPSSASASNFRLEVLDTLKYAYELEEGELSIGVASPIDFGVLDMPAKSKISYQSERHFKTSQFQIKDNKESRVIESNWSQRRQRKAFKSRGPKFYGTSISGIKMNEVTMQQKGRSQNYDEEDKGNQLVPLSNFDSSEARNKVIKTISLFRKTFWDVLRKENAKSNEEGRRNRIDLLAAKIVKAEGWCANAGIEAILGDVSGVKVGDKFNFRVELHLIGLHRPFRNGIDFVRRGNTIIATSIVASGGYDDYTKENGDVLYYSGQGGNPSAKTLFPEDQKLERGNLSLKNSMDEKTPVRVIRGLKDMKDTKGKMVHTFSYHGLYKVEDFWQVRGPHGNVVFRFRLRRTQGQPRLGPCLTYHQLKD